MAGPVKKQEDVLAEEDAARAKAYIRGDGEDPLRELAIQEGITDRYLIRKGKRELNAKKTQFFAKDGIVRDERTVIDWSIRQTARIEFHKMLGHYAATKVRIGTLEEELSRMTDEELERNIRELESRRAPLRSPSGAGPQEPSQEG